MICVSISNLSQLAPVVQSGPELIELRLDLIRSEPAALFNKIPKHIRTVVTCRPDSYSESERIQLLTSAIQLGATFVDLELESTDNFIEPVMKTAAVHSCQVIFSHHDFEATPGLTILKQKVDQCYERGGVIAKIATQVQTRQDLSNLLSLYEMPGKKVILGMGELGRITRVTAPYLGAEFTYASPEISQETAPGQLSATKCHL